MGAKLVATVYVTDPKTHERVRLDAGSEPEPHLAALVTNPSAWEDGKLPAAVEEQDPPKTESATAKADDSDSKPAAKKTAATRPARGRKSADGEGTSG